MATEELTREIRDKRVAIAKDVIARLDMKKVTLGIGSYVFGQLPSESTLITDVQKQIDVIESNCQVCMLGAALLSKARLYNNVPVSALKGMESDTIIAWRSDTVGSLTDVFDEATLDLMESVFERSSMGDAAPLWMREDAARLGSSLSGSEVRVRAICQNLIDHDGEFVLPAPVAPREGVR